MDRTIQDQAARIGAALGISTAEATARLERMRRDPDLWAAYEHVRDETGEDVVVTNVSRDGSGNFVAMVAPPRAVVTKGRAAGMTEQTKEILRQVRSVDEKTARMRREVAAYEVQRAFGRRARTALPMFFAELGGTTS